MFFRFFGSIFKVVECGSDQIYNIVSNHVTTMQFRQKLCKCIRRISP